MQIESLSFCVKFWNEIQESENFHCFSHFLICKIFCFCFIARERFHSESEESLGSEQEAEAERELQRHTTMGEFNLWILICLIWLFGCF